MLWRENELISLAASGRELDVFKRWLETIWEALAGRAECEPIPHIYLCLVVFWGQTESARGQGVYKKLHKN